jgi:hypothetical protein
LLLPAGISPGGHAVAEHSLSKGDKVEWKSHGHNVKGEVVEKITDDPQYRVTSDKTGSDAVHKPDALRPEKH